MEAAFLVLLGCGHGFVDVDVAAVLHVEQHAGFGTFSGANAASRLLLRGARTSQASPSASQQNDVFGDAVWMGYDPAAGGFSTGARIRAQAEQNWGAGHGTSYIVSSAATSVGSLACTMLRTSR